MIHVETLKQFTEVLPSAEENRGRQKTFDYKEKGDGRDAGYKSKGKATFISTYMEGMKKWVWIYQGSVMI
jgi:hypothetical protein